MTELIAYRYKQRTADEIHETRWTTWRTGCLREAMMTELNRIGKHTVTIVQCCVPRGETDPIDGRFNDLWQWTPARGWHKSNNRNWFVDSCDPTQPMDADADDNPFGKGRELTLEERDAIRRQVYGTHDCLTDAITADEMATE